VGSACQRPLVADVLAIPLPPTRADGDSVSNGAHLQWERGRRRVTAR
jgi:hypothetical protein